MKPSHRLDNGNLPRYPPGEKPPLQDRDQNLDNSSKAVDLASESRPVSPFFDYQPPTSSSLDSLNYPKSDSASQLGDPPEIYPEESASQAESDYDSDDDFDDFNYFNDPLEEMSETDSILYASSKLSAGGDKWEVFRNRLTRAGVRQVDGVRAVHVKILASIQAPKALGDLLELALEADLKLLHKLLKENKGHNESYLTKHMDPIIEVSSCAFRDPCFQHD